MKTITIYSSPTCVWCHRTKSFLDEMGVKYTDIDIAGNQQAITTILEKTGQMGVPVIDIDGKFIVGFDQQAIEDALT